MKQPKQQQYPYWPPAPPGFQMVPIEPAKKKGKAQKAQPKPSSGVPEFFIGLLIGTVVTFVVMTIFAPRSRPAFEQPEQVFRTMPTARPLTIQDYRRAYPDEASSPE